MDDPDLLFLLVPLALCLAAFGAWLHRRRLDDLVASLAGDRELVAERRGFLGPVVVESRDRALPTSLRSVKRGGQHGRHYWRVTVDNVALGRRSTLELYRNTRVNRWRLVFATPPVTTGDAGFDGQVILRGGAPSVIARVFGDRAVRSAVAAFFAPGRVRRCRLDGNGRLTVEIRRRRFDREDCREAIQRTRAVAAALAGA
jgi:hypothetical protein